jgi:hypothetical protein
MPVRYSLAIMKLLERADLVCQRRGMSRKTARVYCHWIRRYLAFCAAMRGRWIAPEQLGTADVESFLNDLVGERHLAASTQNQALNALVFLYKHVLEDAIARDHLGKFELLRSKRPKRVPTVLSTAEVARVLAAIPSGHIFRLMAELLYGTGLRVSECCTLRVRDIDLDRAQVIVRAGKGDKDRCVMLPAALRASASANNCGGSKRDGGKMRREAGGMRRCPMRSFTSGHAPDGSGHINTCFRRTSCAGTTPDGGRGGTCTRAHSIAASAWRPAGRGSESASPATRSATASRRTCWKRGMTFGRSRRCSVTLR